ncbi:SIR2 family protein [Dyadobacter sp. LHD-138]|uniref:SIR2 family NAD-dependent protein deacylase n=1 Tax=Dyadobacter sp. LHD-138 TaxID=3071413 RepID=UPI0027E12499|nr:SIR2 family protein [Dyadobacter sp. LHD-138]MDQ6482405.1 SIR2 family protein [Dyadobacter sp. LHD-138]
MNIKGVNRRIRIRPRPAEFAFWGKSSLIAAEPFFKNMVRENLFRLIRSEDVVLWAGAGMSIYAGYPSGKELTKLINDRIEESMGSSSPKALSLMEAAENLVLLQRGSRNELNNLLFKIFRKEPQKTSVHNLLTKIPHIKTIVTTNYDCLFEKVYGADARSVYRPDQVAGLGQADVEIFKAHGDLSDLNSIIITRGDYDHFFSRDTGRNLLWNAIRDRISRHSILFVGYSLEDANVSVVLDKLISELGSNRKQIFFVAPGISSFQRLALDGKNIQYIDCTAERLFKEIITILRENITDDFKSEKVSIKTTGKFLRQQNIGSKLTIADGKPVISQVYPINKNLIGRLSFTLSQNDAIAKTLLDYIKGEKVGTITIPAEKIKGGGFWLGKTKISKGLGSFTISRVPAGSWQVDIRFKDGFEYQDAKVEVFRNEGSLLIHLHLKTAFVEIKIDLGRTNDKGWETKFSHTHPDKCSRMTEQIKDFTFLAKLSDEKVFTVFHEGIPVHTGNLLMRPLFKLINLYRQVFEACRFIEIAYERTFRDVPFGAINEDTIATINEICLAGKRESIHEEFEQMKITFDETLDEGNREKHIMLNFGRNNIQLHSIKTEEVTLFGERFSLGIMVTEIVQPILMNRINVENGSDDFAIVKSKVRKRMRFYLPDNQ